jgi:hypothetical protein
VLWFDKIFDTGYKFDEIVKLSNVRHFAKSWILESYKRLYSGVHRNDGPRGFQMHYKSINVEFSTKILNPAS